MCLSWPTVILVQMFSSACDINRLWLISWFSLYAVLYCTSGFRWVFKESLYFSESSPKSERRPKLVGISRNSERNSSWRRIWRVTWTGSHRQRTSTLKMTTRDWMTTSLEIVSMSLSVCLSVCYCEDICAWETGVANSISFYKLIVKKNIKRRCRIAENFEIFHDISVNRWILNL